MPSNWRGVAERGDKVRSRDRGRGGDTSEGEQPVKFEDRGRDGKRQTLSEPRLTTQSIVHELITFGHMLCGLDKNAVYFLNVSLLAQSQESVRSTFRPPLRVLGRSVIHPYVLAAVTDSG